MVTEEYLGYTVGYDIANDLHTAYRKGLNSGVIKERLLPDLHEKIREECGLKEKEKTPSEMLEGKLKELGLWYTKTESNKPDLATIKFEVTIKL